MLSKNSALNFYLEGIARKALGNSTKELTAAELEANAAKAQALAESEGITLADAEMAVASQAAAESQNALTTALLANPIGVILAALASLVAAYELYIHTLGAATDAEKEKQAATEALNAANAAAIDSIAKEESNLSELLVTAKSETASKFEKEQRLELASQYPEYLEIYQRKSI